MDVFIINRFDEHFDVKECKIADYIIREEFYPSSQYVRALDEEDEKSKIEDFLTELQKAGCTVDFKEQSFIIPNDSIVLGKIHEKWMNLDKLNEELDGHDRSATGFVELLRSLKYWIEYADALPVVVDGVSYPTIVEAVSDMNLFGKESLSKDDCTYCVCQALYMKP